MSKISIISLIFVVFASLLYVLTVRLFEAPKLPKFDYNVWWGPGKPQVNYDQAIKPFKIALPQKVLDDINQRLNMTRTFTPPLEGTQQQYGFNTNLLKDMLHLLQSQYNYQNRLEYLNQFPQFTTNIQGLNIHFLHVKPSNVTDVKVVPILLLHGWPSSVREFYEMIPVLTEKHKERGFVFEVVAPSLVGFGYSDGAAKPNCDAPQLAIVYRNLMKRLGFERFYVHGSDWGSLVGANIATIFPDAVLGYHSNFCLSLRTVSLAKIGVASVWPSFFIPKEHMSKLYPLYKSVIYFLKEGGYFHMQATKPDTLGVGLENSLEGLMAFVLEKISVGTHKRFLYQKNAGLLEKYDYNLLFDTLMFYYWIPKKATTAARIYTENFALKTFDPSEMNNIPVDAKVPCACAVFENEFLYMPPWVVQDKLQNLVQFNYYEDGGHFAALEKPSWLVNDIVAFVQKVL